MGNYCCGEWRSGPVCPTCKREVKSISISRPEHPGYCNCYYCSGQAEKKSLQKKTCTEPNQEISAN